MKRLRLALAAAQLFCVVAIGQETPTAVPAWARPQRSAFSLPNGGFSLKPLLREGPVCSFLEEGSERLDFIWARNTFGTAPEDTLESSLSGRFVALFGGLRHEQNPNAKTYPAEPPLFDKSGYDRVLLVVDYNQCRVAGIISVPPSSGFDGCVMFADNDSALFRVSGKRTFIYSGERFQNVAAVLDFPAVCSGANPAQPQYQYWFPNGYYTLSGYPWCFVVMKRDGDRHTLVETIGCEVLRNEAASTPAGGSTELGTTRKAVLRPGEELALREPVFADDKILVLHYETQAAGLDMWRASQTPGTIIPGPRPTRPAGAAEGVKRQFLSTLSLANLRVTLTDLPAQAKDVKVEQTPKGLTCSFSEPGAAGHGTAQKSTLVRLPD